MIKLGDEDPICLCLPSHVAVVTTRPKMDDEDGTAIGAG